MFLQRLFAPFRSLFSRRPPDHDLNAEARVILQRVRELMELTPAMPLASCGGESTATLEPATSLAATDPYGERSYAEDTH
jgi:hypothetical protein